MKAHFRLLVLTIAFLSFGELLAQGGYAGGYITYIGQGNNVYNVKMRRYFHCTGNISAPHFPRIPLYDDQFNLLPTSFILFIDDSLSISVDTANCVTNPTGICYKYREYDNLAVLPPRTGGYILTNGLGFRSNQVVNLPASTAFLVSSIPSNDGGLNTSPQIGDPLIMSTCLNRPMSITLPVTEPDGDSLSFEFCDVYKTGPSPITYSPPYTTSSPMGGSPPISIDARTGQITGTPTQAGLFTIGICINEWRNGVKISYVTLDYMIQVFKCSYTIADMLTQAEDTTLNCQGQTVNFVNQSQFATTYMWDFGDPTVLTDTSSQVNPTYTYSRPGTYTVRLVTDSGAYCSDTMYSVFDVRDSIKGNLILDSLYCFKDQPIQIDAAMQGVDSNAIYNWDFGPLADKQISVLRVPPPTRWSSGGSHYIELTVRNGNCSTVVGDTVHIKPKLLADMLTADEDPTVLCTGLTVNFTSQSTGATRLHWNFGDTTTLADTSNLSKPGYTYPAPGAYTVTLIAEQNGQCFDTTSFVFNVFEPLQAKIKTSGVYCFEGQDILFQADGVYPPGTTFKWDLGPFANKPFATTALVPHVAFSVPGTYIVKLTATKGVCSVVTTDTITTEAWTVNADAGPNQVINEGDLLQLDGSPASDYYWSSSHTVMFSSPFGRNPSVEISHTGDSIYFYYVVTDAQGCQGKDTMAVFITSNKEEGGYNIITANGDGRNDFLDLSEYMRGNDCGLTVLNRWGSEVYKVADYNNDWAGVDDSSNPLADGTYYYILVCDRELVLKGPITIINGQ